MNPSLGRAVQPQRHANIAKDVKGKRREWKGRESAKAVINEPEIKTLNGWQRY